MRLFRRNGKPTPVGTVLGIGNCQVEGMVRCAAAALGLQPVYLHRLKAKSEPDLLANAIANARVVFCQRRNALPQMRDIAVSAGRPDLPILSAPSIYFPGFHPDVVYPAPAGERPDLPMGNAFSAILLAAWRDGLGVDQAISLFRDDVYDALGYYETFGLARDALASECAVVGFDVGPLMSNWLDRGPFVYLPLHPKIHVLRDIAMTQLRLAQLHDGTPANQPVDDELSRNLIWPVYPEIARRLGLAGDYIFRPKNMKAVARADLAPMDLAAFVERTFSCFRERAPVLSAFERLTDPRLEKLDRFVKSAPAPRDANPYKSLSSTHWWSKAVAEPSPEDVDPVVGTKFLIGRRDRVATAGSCFAQHMSKRLVQNGFHYLVTEKAPPDCSDPGANDYGTFTARFGNIYTVRQLLQLADRAYGSFQPEVETWKVADGYLDPFRPRIGGSPFSSLDELEKSREAHFAAVREMFETANIFVFTLGLTEAWIARADQAVVPLPPGVVGADLPADTYVPHSFTVTEVLADLQSLVSLFQVRNPGVRILLTVSPVPLIATHGDEHVLAATTYSKSVLRAAAGDIARSNAHVAYFPSYEIITGSFSGGRYFADDLRQVTEAGVDHVMRVFMRHFAALESPASADPVHAQRFHSETIAAMDIICDEEEIGHSLGNSEQATAAE